MVDAQREANAALLELQSAQSASVLSVAEHVQQHHEVIEAAITWIAELDAQWQRLLFVASYEHCVADVALDGSCAFVEAALLPLSERLGAGYTPISYIAAPLAIITGSNMGGKSAALATAAFLALLVQRGLPVPATSARIALYDEVLGLQGNEIAREGLSDFGEEMMRLRQIVTADARQRLVIIDEFARTTNVKEGRALLIAVIRYLCARGDTVAVATHIDAVAAALGVAPYRIAGLHEPIDTADTDSPATLLFRISRAFDRRLVKESPDAPLPTDALTIAAAFGLPAEIVEDARKGSGSW
jgi:DNA mismatch repair protein MutS2